MENLNAEKIKIALKCCDGTLAGCKECPNYNNRYRCKIEAEALALINSQEQMIKAQDMTISELRKLLEKAEHDADRYAQRIKGLTEENERLMRDKTALECIVATARNQAKADTVRKMQESVSERIKGIYIDEYTMNEILDQTAKEILEGAPGNG